MKKIWVLVSVLVLLGLLVGAVAIGCGEAKKEEAAVANLTAQKLLKGVMGSIISTSGTNSGTISGKITDMLTGNPLIGKTVSAGGKSATTSSSGNYTLSGVTAGTVTFSTNASGYEDISIVCNSSTINIGLLPEDRSPIGTISGKVTDSGGNPVAGARVEAASETYFQVESSKTTTDSSGNYTLTNEAGDVVVCAVSSTIEANGDWRIISSQYKRINLGTAATVNLQFPASTGTISGTITNNSIFLDNTSFSANLLVGASGVPVGSVPAPGGQYSCSVPPTQGSDMYWIIGYGWKSASSRWYWPCDYVSVSTGETVTRNFTVQEPIQQIGPTDEAVVGSTPAFSWKPGTGSTFDYYVIDIYADVPPSGMIVRRIITENLSYTLTSDNSLNPGGYYWGVAGLKSKTLTDLSNFDVTKTVIDYGSQQTEYHFTVQ